jgi:NDP-sugar pyrophosphorylase family protein
MLVPVRPVEGLEGDFVFQENHVVKEISRFKESEMYCSGIQVLNPYRLTQITSEGDSFYEVWQQLIDQGQLFVSSVYPKKWFAVDTIEQLTTLNKSPF